MVTVGKVPGGSATGRRPVGKRVVVGPFRHEHGGTSGITPCGAGLTGPPADFPNNIHTGVMSFRHVPARYGPVHAVG